MGDGFVAAVDRIGDISILASRAGVASSA